MNVGKLKRLLANIPDHKEVSFMFSLQEMDTVSKIYPWKEYQKLFEEETGEPSSLIADYVIELD